MGQALFAALGAGSSALYLLGLYGWPGTEPTSIVPLPYAIAFAAYLAAAWLVWRMPGKLRALHVIGFAVAFRIAAASEPPALSSDVYRYAWDGHVARSGVSPYRHPPGAEALAPLRDEHIQPRVNRPDERTVYPPGAQLLYACLPYDIDAVRFAMIGFDLGTMLLLAELLRRLALDPARVILYAWSPLAVYEVGNGGHLDAAMVFLLVAAVLAHRARRDGGAGLLVGAAISLKLYPALALVALARSRPARVLAAAGALVLVLYVAFAWPVGTKVLGFLPRYFGSGEDHNVGLRALLEWPLTSLTSHARPIAFATCAATLVLGIVALQRRPAPIELALLRLVGLYLLTLPTAFHPWYALWLLPWLCVHPRASWLWLSAALPLSYLKYAAPGGIMPGWIVPLELMPTVGLLLWEARTKAREA